MMELLSLEWYLVHRDQIIPPLLDILFYVRSAHGRSLTMATRMAAAPQGS